MEYILAPWPWYIGGPLIALVMILLILNGKYFGMSSNLRTLCTICGAGKSADFFKVDWKAQKWNLLVAFGALVGGFIAAFYLSEDQSVHIAAATVQDLSALGFEDAGMAYLPAQLFSWDALRDMKSLILLATGGFLVGFGTRYAGGCTSGHAIYGLSNLQPASLVAVIGFFMGGLLMVYFLFPIIFHT